MKGSNPQQTQRPSLVIPTPTTLGLCVSRPLLTAIKRQPGGVRTGWWRTVSFRGHSGQQTLPAVGRYLATLYREVKDGAAGEETEDRRKLPALLRKAEDRTRTCIFSLRAKCSDHLSYSSYSDAGYDELPPALVECREEQKSRS